MIIVVGDFVVRFSSDYYLGATSDRSQLVKFVVMERNSTSLTIETW